MKEGLIEARFHTLIRNIQKDKTNHVSVNEFRFGITEDKTLAKKYNFDIRKHYEMLKENHPLWSIAHAKKEIDMKKSYISISDGHSSLKSSIETGKNTCMNKYGKEKLVKFRKGEGINFNELHDKIQSIGQ